MWGRQMAQILPVQAGSTAAPSEAGVKQIAGAGPGMFLQFKVNEREF